MKKALFIILLLLIGISSFADSSPAVEATETQNNQVTFSQIKEIDNLPQLFEYLKEFVSWKHWRYWVGLAGSILLWLLFVIINGSLYDLFPSEIEGKLIAKEGKYYLFWIGYSFIIAVFFTFGYSYLMDFFSNIDIFAIPAGSHWITWVLWVGLVLLLIGALPAFIREIIVFRSTALYTIPYQIIHGTIGIILAFFVTTAVTYFVVAVGIVVGAVIVFLVGLSILGFMLKSMTTPRSGVSKTDADDQYNKKVKEMNSRYKKQSEDDKRRREQQERYNREQMKKNRGW